MSSRRPWIRGGVLLSAVAAAALLTLALLVNLSSPVLAVSVPGIIPMEDYAELSQRGQDFLQALDKKVQEEETKEVGVALPSFLRWFGNNRRGCWSIASLSIDSACKSASEEELSKLALALTNCHLREAGESEYKCNAVPAHCARKMSSKVFSAYTDPSKILQHGVKGYAKF